MNAVQVFAGSDADLTKRFYTLLCTFGPIGLIAMNLFRAQKASTRAKLYRGGIRGKGSFKSLAYDRKSWSMGVLAEILGKHADELAIVWGWQQDRETPFGEQPSWVLYVEIPQGQVSFHSPTRGIGPAFPSVWDKQHKSQERIIAFCDSILRTERRLEL